MASVEENFTGITAVVNNITKGVRINIGSHTIVLSEDEAIELSHALVEAYLDDDEYDRELDSWLDYDRDSVWADAWDDDDFEESAPYRVDLTKHDDEDDSLTEHLDLLKRMGLVNEDTVVTTVYPGSAPITFAPGAFGAPSEPDVDKIHDPVYAGASDGVDEDGYWYEY